MWGLSVPFGKQLERVPARMDAFNENRLRAQMVLKFADVVRSCYASFVKASDVLYGNYDADITNPIVSFRRSGPIARAFESAKKAAVVFVINILLDWQAVHCLILDDNRRSTEDRQLWR